MAGASAGVRIRVKLFGPQAELAGARELSVRVPGDAPTAQDVLAALRFAAPELAPSLETSRLAVNHVFAEPGRPIDEADEVALIGMVGGG